MKTFTTYAEKKAKQFLNLLQGYTKGIRITAILILLLMGVSNAWAVDHTGGYIYFLKPSTWTESKVMMFIGHDSYTSVYEMTKVSNTDNLYRYTMPSWGGATYVAFANDSYVWGTGNWGPSNRTNAKHYTNVYNNYGFNSGSYYVVVPASTSNNAGITINYKSSASNLNLTTRANVYGSTDGGSTYASMAAAGTVSVSGYYMSNYSTASTRSAVSSTSSQAYASTTLAPGSTATFKATASDGYEFVGWFDAASGGTAVSTSTTYTYKYDISYTGKTVYARFKKQYKILFGVHSSGHGSLTAKVGDTSISSGNRVNYGSEVVFTAKPDDGYQIEGWYSNSACTTPIDNGTNDTYTVTITIGTNVYVKFKAQEYTITYKDQEGSNFSGTHESGHPTTHTYGPATTLKTASKTGYTFEGWYKESACTNKVTSLGATAYTANITLYAKWTANTYTVHFDKNADDAKGSMDDQSFTYDEQKELTKNAFILDKYSFVGWATTKDGEKAYDDQSKVSNLSSIDGATVTLYAKWEPKATYTVTLDQTGAKAKGTTSITATLGDPMPAIELPTPADGYAFMGYWDGKDGSGTQYYDAAGESVREWNQAKNTTLYAYFKKAEITSITLDNDVFESGETGYVTVTNHTIEPADPAGTVVVCWTLCYTNGTPVEEHDAIEENGTVKFAIDGLSAGTYKIVASLRLNNCNGEELDTAEATFVVAGSYTVTIKYTCDGQEIAGRTTIEGHPSRETEVTAPEIGGYNFVKWELGDGISTTDALTSDTINITANYEGYLTATYEKKKLIFLDISTLPDKDKWTAPHVYLYKGAKNENTGGYWNDLTGAGGATGGNYITHAAMTKVPDTENIWYFDYEQYTNNFNVFVAFTSNNQGNVTHFADCEVIYRADFTSGTPVFVPASDQTAETKNSTAKYYSKGYWVRYMGGTGYWMIIYDAEGNKELVRREFTSETQRMTMTSIVDLEAKHTYKYEIYRNDGYYYNGGDITYTNSSNYKPLNEANKHSIKTTESGNYTFTLDYSAGDLQIKVQYPVEVGDYRILYKDNTRTTYKPSDIKKAEELNPVTSFFIRPKSNPELKIQTATYISDGDVSWSTTNADEIHFKPNDLWKSDNARFAAYFYKGNTTKVWKDLTKNGDIYTCEKPSGCTHVIFCRMNPDVKTNSFDKGDGKPLWNQTRDLTLPTDKKNFYTLEEGAWRGQIYLKPNNNWTTDGARFAAYFYNGSQNEWHSMFKEDDGTYWCDIPEGYSQVIFCRMNPNVQDNNWDTGYWGMQTYDLQIPTNSNDLYTITNGQNKPTGAWSCKSWNEINTGSITDLTEEFKEKLGEINGDIGKAPDSVYTIHLSNNEGTLTIEKVAFYTGNFYIRVDAAAGKWYDYKTNPDNLMTYSAFSESDANSFGEKFSHYKTEWCSDGMNVKFVIANDYSPCISDTLVQDEGNPFNNINENGNLTNEYNYNANIRFMWNRSTNKVSRAYVASATNPDLKFLVLKTNENIQDKDGKEVKEVIFQDTQNWIYEYTIKAKPGTRVKLYACYPTDDESKAQHFRGEYDDPATFGESNSVQILGGTDEEAWNTIRVLYDFKTNRLMGAWVPESAISTNQAIAADLMVIRRHQEDATCVTLTNENSKLTDVKTAYGAMQFNRWTINNRGGADDLDVKHCTKLIGSHREYDEDTTNLYHPILPLAEQKSIYERGLYFISFPFDVHLSDVFGFGTYGTHWVISTYNGKRRAERGYFAEDCINEDCTNWDYIWDPSGFVMKANEGYLLSLDLDLMKHDSTSFWANNIGQVELFFPSTAAVKSIEKTDYTMPPLGEEYLCKINHNTQDGDRRVKDSYWRCIGVPSFADYDGSLTTDGESTINWKADYTWKADNGAFPFLYEWNVTNNDLVVRSTNSYKFRATYAYLIQNGNEIHWEAVNTNKPASIIARDQIENMSNYEWKIALLRNDAPADHTFIRMTDNESVTSAFDFHQDLSKEFNYGANIYTLVGYERLAANSLPMSDSTTIIPLGVSAQEAGDYTITMPEGVESIGITLVDNETGIHTNLSAGQEYTLTLNKGICENRLFIEVSPIQNTPTDLEYTTEDTREQTTRKMLIDGILYLIRDGVIYDAQGHRL